MQPGTVRPIEYEFVARNEAMGIGLTAGAVMSHLGLITQVGVLRCVDERGEKLTAVCNADHLRNLLASGDASEPNGMKLPKRTFPVVIPGWLPTT
jgi:hypothetical protein